MGGEAEHRILIADDDVQGLRLMRRVLRGVADDVVAAASGEEALELLPQIRPDVVLLDIVMPGMNGYEVCRRIREHERHGLAKILLISGRGETPDRLEGYRAGADDFITKPYDNEELRAKVSVYLRLKRAEELDRARGDLRTLFAHETRTPLSGIIGLAEMLHENEDLPREARMSARLIRENGLRLLEFVRKTSLLVELDHGRDAELESSSVSGHVAAAVESRREHAERREVKIEVSIRDDERLSADWPLVEEVLGYLLDNAIEFSHRGGEVRVVARCDESICEFEVADDGEGIPAEWQQRIFDEFAVRDIDHHNKGQGLSLAIARRVMDLHDGGIRVRSAPGRGATFTLELPLASSKRPTMDILPPSSG